MNPIVVSYGGGANSLGVLIGYYERGIRPDAIIFADTLGEKPATYFNLRTVLPSWLEQIGFPPLTPVTRAHHRRTRTGDESLEAECLRLGYMPSRAYGYGTCADKWKIDPFVWWLREWPVAIDAWARGGVVTRVIGFDADEAHRVESFNDPGFVKTYPLIEWGWTRDDCEAAARRHGLPVPPKSACFYCPSSTKAEVLALARDYPLHFRRAVDMEQAALANGKSRIKGLGRRWSWKELVEADDAQREEFPEAPVEPCVVCVAGA